MNNDDDNIIDINDIIKGLNTDDEIMDEDEQIDDEVIDISDREFVEAIYASDGVDSPCCWLSFAPKGVYCAVKESIEWGHEEKDGVMRMVPEYFEDILGNSYVYVK